MSTLKNSHVVLTGGTDALGVAVVRALVEAGAHCIRIGTDAPAAARAEARASQAWPTSWPTGAGHGMAISASACASQNAMSISR
jgi:NAD(P)-dependent dehydrogenase (short-subunit alcohol dehydrogenase family)